MHQTVSGATTTQLLYDGADLVMEYDGANAVKRHYVFGQNVDEPLVWYQGVTPGSGNRNYLHTDELGSVVATSDNSGVATPYAYDAYGRPANDNWSGSRFRYTGQIALNEDGGVHLYYYKARVYDPVLGRFLQTDLIGYADGLNWYGYVHNDPANGRDSSGLDDGRGGDPDTIVVNGLRELWKQISNFLYVDNYVQYAQAEDSRRGQWPCNGGIAMCGDHIPDSSEKRPHHYDNTVGVCRTNNPNCTKEKVYQCLRLNPSPFYKGPAVTEGMRANVPGFGPVYYGVSTQNYVVMNNTLPGHILFPGWVFRQVVERGNEIGIHTVGGGNGDWATLNEAGSVDMWYYQTVTSIINCVG